MWFKNAFGTPKRTISLDMITAHMIKISEKYYSTKLSI